MTPEELDEARANEAWRIWNEEDGVTDEGHAVIAARLAREGWKPPEPVDPDVLAFREWAAIQWPSEAAYFLAGERDRSIIAKAYLAGARMAREQERERTNHAVAFAVRVMAGVFCDLDQAKLAAKEALAKYREGQP